jgi:hypothetical protein
MNNSTPKILLHAEGLAIFVAAIAAYAYTSGNGWAFLLLLLAPDLAMVGYLVNVRVGSITYNAVHNLVLPLALLAGAWLAGSMTLVHIALIWLAHIGMDRMMGYGLKYATDFKDTHMQHV